MRSSCRRHAPAGSTPRRGRRSCADSVRFFADLPSTVGSACTPAFDGSGSVVLQAIVYSAAGDTTESSDDYGPAVTLDGCP